MPPLPLAADPREDLLGRIAELEQAVRARDDFLAVAAHELRSPLNALSLRLAVLEQLAERGRTAELAEQIRRTRRSADRYARRAVVLLDVSRLNAGTVELAKAPVDIRRLVDEVADAHADEAASRDIALTTEVQDGTGLWDPHMAEEILSNLVSNALKYGGGTPVHLSARLDGDHARFEVTDRGPGIDASQRARLFQKFERLVTASSDRAGYGLGLWIVGRMVTAHDGTIEIESAPGQRTTFRVCLPLGPAALNMESPK